ncbi:hypothetical protein R3P38DRAFT_3218414 [Favolaschia claudopus]|uniref:Uncharacterized protein n=1 Tax=Favolaschia claudopus TaxID=2862362 RepID=A0AAW0A4J2_9AGAR
MSAKKRAIGNTEDEFQAALATYTKAGNKMVAMRRLWNAAYEMGYSAAREAGVTSRGMDEATQKGFDAGRKEGFEEGRKVGGKEVLTADASAVAFSAGKMDGLSEGVQLGREDEKERWIHNGHFENGTCRAAGAADTSVMEENPSPPPTTTDDGANIMSLLMGFDWADDADASESALLHTMPPTPQPPRDFSSLRSGSRNAFSTLQRRHSRNNGFRAYASRRREFYCARPRHFTSSTSSTTGTTYFGSRKDWSGVLAWASVGWLAQAALKGVDAVVDSGGFGHRAHCDSAGFPFDERQRIQTSPSVLPFLLPSISPIPLGTRPTSNTSPASTTSITELTTVSRRSPRHRHENLKDISQTIHPNPASDAPSHYTQRAPDTLPSSPPFTISEQRAQPAAPFTVPTTILTVPATIPRSTSP